MLFPNGLGVQELTGFELLVDHVTSSTDFYHLCPSAANYMDNWKCTGILKGDGSPLTGSSGQPTAMSTTVGSSVHASQNALNGMSAGR